MSEETSYDVPLRTLHNGARGDGNLPGLRSLAISRLNRAGIMTVSDLLTMREDEIIRIRNFGRKSLEEIKFALKSRGLYLQGDESMSENDGTTFPSKHHVIAMLVDNGFALKRAEEIADRCVNNVFQSAPKPQASRIGVMSLNLVREEQEAKLRALSEDIETLKRVLAKLPPDPYSVQSAA